MTPLPTTMTREAKRMIVKPGKHRFGVHYDSVPHGGCPDPARCDCECRACLSSLMAHPATTSRMKLRLAVILQLLAHPKSYERFPALDAMERCAAFVRPNYSLKTRVGDIEIGLRTIVPQVRALRNRGVR